MESNANVDYCGVLNLLRYMIKQGVCTQEEAQKIAARAQVRLGADVLLSPSEFGASGYSLSEEPVIMCVADKGA